MGEGISSSISSIAALGNVFLPATAPFALLEAGGVAVHLALSFGYSLLLSNLLIRNSSLIVNILACTAASLAIHVTNLMIIPSFYHMPLLDELLANTGMLPHLLDHIAFGLVIGTVLGLRKQRREKQLLEGGGNKVV